MAKCWKCGKEVSGFRESLVGFSTCPECETLEVLKRMEEEKREQRQAELEARREERKQRQRERVARRLGIDVEDLGDFLKDNLPEKVEPTDTLSPAWWKRARNPKNPVSAAILAFLFGHGGIPFMYIGKGWTILGVGMFITFIVVLMTQCPTACCIYVAVTNLLVAGLFLGMDEDDFLKWFRNDQWIDKKIADQYGHKVDKFGNYTDVPLNKPSWDEVFPQKSSGDSCSNVKEEAPPTEDESEEVPPTEDESEEVPPTEDESEEVPPTEDESEEVPPTEDESEEVPPTEDESEVI